MNRLLFRCVPCCNYVANLSHIKATLILSVSVIGQANDRLLASSYYNLHSSLFQYIVLLIQ